MEETVEQKNIDYGYWFAKHYFHGQMIAVLSGKISEELMKEVEECFK